MKKETKWKVSHDYMEIVEDAWGGIPEEEREELLSHLMGMIQDKWNGELPFEEVFRQGWGHGFMYCMVCMESGALRPLGVPGEN